MLAPIAAVLLQAALSRSREFEADRGGAELLGTGEPLAPRAAEDRGLRQAGADERRPGARVAFIVNPLTGRKVQFANLFTTHPPTEERVRRLRTYAPA